MFDFEKRNFITYSLLVCCSFISHFNQYDASTEVFPTSWDINRSFGVDIKVPHLICHAKFTVYQKVQWYFRGTLFGDNILLKNGSNDFAGHSLSLSSLLGETSTVQFDHPLKLQGYYWCKTDYPNATTAHKYLYRATEVHTYFGKFLSKQFTLGNNDLEKRIFTEKEVYENEIQEKLFGFLSNLIVYVTDVVDAGGNGEEVFFFLYEWTSLQPRRPFRSELETDSHAMQYIMEYIRNETDVDEYQQDQFRMWLHARAVNVDDIHIYSTLGCHKDETLEPADPPHVVTWPDALIDEVVIPEEGCSSKNGLAVTRLCTGSFYSGAKWGNPSGRCNVPANNLTSALVRLYYNFGKDPKPKYIERVQEITQNSSHLTVTDLHIVTNILERLSNVKELKPEEVDEMFSVVDILFSTQQKELLAAKDSIKFTYRMLQIIENVLKVAAKRKRELLITKDNFLIETKDPDAVREADHIIGVSILMPKGGKNISLVEFIFKSSPSPKHASLAYFLLPPDLVIKKEEGGYPPQLDVVFVNNRRLFPNFGVINTTRKYEVLPTPVIQLSISGETAWDLTVPVQIFFKNMYEERVIETAICVYYDPRLNNDRGSWSTEGCRYGGLKEGFFICRCHHLSMFTIILAEKMDSGLYLGTSVYLGSGFSMLGLSLTVLLYLLSKEFRATVDQSVLFWLALSLLVCMVLMFISEMHFLSKPGCVLLALLLHYTILVIAGWLLVQGVVHRLRFAHKTDMEEVPHFIIKAVLSVWGTPIFIIFIIWFTKDYENSHQNNCLKTVSDVSLAAVIPIAIVLLVALWLNICAVYAITCRFKKDFLVDDSTYNESVLKFRVAFAIFFFFVISWLFGFFALHKSIKELRILFSISITLTSYYIMLFFIFYEVSFWEMCKKWRKNKVQPAEVVKYTAEKEGEENHKPTTNGS